MSSSPAASPLAAAKLLAQEQLRRGGFAASSPLLVPLAGAAAAVTALVLAYHFAVVETLPFLPLYYQLVAFILLGAVLFALNLVVLARFSPAVSALALLGVDAYTPAALLSVAGAFSGVVLATAVVYESTSISQQLPLVTLVVMLGVLVNPFDVLYKRHRFDFMGCVVRCCALWSASAVAFVDVILMDIATSFSRILGDLFVFVYVACFAPADSVLAVSSLFKTKGAVVDSSVMRSLQFPVYLVVALPYLIRFRQCVTEYYVSPAPEAKRRHALNAVKYLTTLPVLAVSCMIGLRKAHYATTRDLEQGFQDSAFLFNLWILFSLINTIYSLLWDILVDWELFTVLQRIPNTRALLTVLPTLITSSNKKALLREHLLLPTWVYFFAVAADTILRFSWVAKVNPTWQFFDYDVQLRMVNGGGYTGADRALQILDFWLKMLEVWRRWLWCFVRIEREAVSGFLLVKAEAAIEIDGSSATSTVSIPIGTPRRSASSSSPPEMTSALPASKGQHQN